MKTIGIHSFKGGAGKTFLALNLAYLLSLKKRVCLIDFDFRAPSLYVFFSQKRKSRYLNALVNDLNNLDDYLIEVRDNLSVILASPDVEEIKRDLKRGEKDELQLLEKLLDVKERLRRKFDFTVLDTSPGLSYRSINSMLVSDILVFVARPERIDLEGLKNLERVTSKLETPKYVVLNRVGIGNFKVETEIPVVARIPCSCEISMDRPFFVEENPEDPVTNEIKKLAEFLLENE